MRDLKEYKAPLAHVTEFECADIITESPGSLKKSISSDSSHTYVHTSSAKWGDIYDPGQ